MNLYIFQLKVLLTLNLSYFQGNSHLDNTRSSNKILEVDKTAVTPRNSNGNLEESLLPSNIDGSSDLDAITQELSELNSELNALKKESRSRLSNAVNAPDSDLLSLSSDVPGKNYSIYSDDLDLSSFDHDIMEQKCKMLTLQLEEANKSLKHERE